MFDFGNWLQIALPTATLLAGINIATVQGLGKWFSGQAQTVVAGVTGISLGFAAGLAIFGTPVDFLGWFLNVIFGLLVYGVSIGTYEAVKHAAAKSS